MTPAYSSLLHSELGIYRGEGKPCPPPKRPPDPIAIRKLMEYELFRQRDGLHPGITFADFCARSRPPRDPFAAVIPPVYHDTDGIMSGPQVVQWFRHPSDGDHTQAEHE